MSISRPSDLTVGDLSRSCLEVQPLSRNFWMWTEFRTFGHFQGRLVRFSTRSSERDSEVGVPTAANLSATCQRPASDLPAKSRHSSNFRRRGTIDRCSPSRTLFTGISSPITSIPSSNVGRLSRWQQRSVGKFLNPPTSAIRRGGESHRWWLALFDATRYQA